MKDNCMNDNALVLENASIVNNIMNNLESKGKKCLAVMPLFLDAKAVQTIRDMAMSIHSLDRKVLLIDATSRNMPFIAETGIKGFAEYVSNNATLSECIYKETAVYDIMPAGDFGDGIGVLHNISLDDKIKVVEEFYDVILVVVTNVNKGPLKASFANRVGLSMLVVNKQEDRKIDLITARDMLSDCIGMVLLNKKEWTIKEFWSKK